MSRRFLLLLVCLTVPAWSNDAPPKHHHDSKPKADLGSSAAFDPQGRLWIVYKNESHVALRHSENFGRSWSDPVNVNSTPEAIGADGDSRPKIVSGSGGELYVTWTHPLSKPYTGEIRFARSLDSGKTFSAPVTVHTDRQKITHRFDAPVVNRDGKVFIAWVDKRDQEAQKGKTPAYRGAAIYFAVSDNRGASFRGDFKLADYSCECCRISLLPNDDGSVTALWRHIFAPNIRDHALARLYPDGRVTEFRRATFDDWRIDACPHHGPSLATDKEGNLHAVWFTQAPARPGVYYGRLREGRIDGEQRVGGETAEHADIAATGKRVAIAWKEFDGERSQLRAMVSNDNGISWKKSSPLASTAGPSDQPRLLVREGNFYIYWNTRLEPFSVVKLP